MLVDPWRIQINASSKLLYIRPWCRPSNQQPQLGELSPPSQAHQAFFCLASVFCAGWASLQFVASSSNLFWQLLFRFRAQGLGSPSSISLKNFFLAVVNFRLSVMPTPISSTRFYTAMVCSTTSQTRTYTQTQLLQLKMEHCMSFLFMLQMSSYHHMDAISVLLTCARYDYNCKKAEAEEAHIIEERRVTECLILQ